MNIHNEFDVPLPVNEAWPRLLDVERVVACLPGAEITEKVDERTFRGRLGVKLGPMALRFRATAQITGVDEATHSASISAQGSDEKGRGGVRSTMRFQLTPDGDGTRVLVDTDVKLSGSIAQYGRGSGMVEDLANHIVAEFASCFRERLAGKPSPAVAADAVASESPASSGARPTSGLTLAVKLVGRALRRWLRRLFGRVR